MVSTQDSESCDPGSNPGRTSSFAYNDTLAEWLRRVIRNHMGFPRAGSNPAGVASFLRIGSHSRRLWCSGYHVWFPTMRPGFDSRLAHVLITRASMAEWSKALDLSSSIRKNAWVRTPLEALNFAPERGGHPRRASAPDLPQHSPRGLMDKA
jgi:hypothetical protein